MNKESENSKKKQGSKKYNESLKIQGTLYDVLKVSVPASKKDSKDKK